MATLNNINIILQGDMEKYCHYTRHTEEEENEISLRQLPELKNIRAHFYNENGDQLEELSRVKYRKLLRGKLYKSNTYDYVIVYGNFEFENWDGTIEELEDKHVFRLREREY